MFVWDLVLQEGWTGLASLSLTSLVISGVVCLGAIVALLRREIKSHPPFADWFAKNQTPALGIALLGATNVEALAVLSSHVGGFDLLSAAWRPECKANILLCGYLTNALEDVPQLIIQIAVCVQAGTVTQTRAISLLATSLMLMLTLLKRGFAFLVFRIQAQMPKAQGIELVETGDEVRGWEMKCDSLRADNERLLAENVALRAKIAHALDDQAQVPFN